MIAFSLDHGCHWRVQFNAIVLLAHIANTEDLERMIERSRYWRDAEAEKGWASVERNGCFRSLIGALVNPSSEEGWRFLHDCLLTPQTPQAFACACMVVELSDSPRSIKLLSDVLALLREQHATAAQVAVVEKALRDRTMLNRSSNAESLDEAVKWLVHALDQRDVASGYEVTNIIVLRDRRTALVRLRNWRSPGTPGYDAVFWHEDGGWHIKGLWLTTIS